MNLRGDRIAVIFEKKDDKDLKSQMVTTEAGILVPKDTKKQLFTHKECKVIGVSPDTQHVCNVGDTLLIHRDSREMEIQREGLEPYWLISKTVVLEVV